MTLIKLASDIKGDIEAKIFLNNSDIGFIKKNMPVQIRVDAFPFTQYGYTEGKIREVGYESLDADNLNPSSRFPAYVTIANKYLEKNSEKHYLKPGQSITANVVVRKKPLITIITDIFQKSFDSLSLIKTRN